MHLAIDGDDLADTLDTFGSTLLKAVKKGGPQAQAGAAVIMALLVQGTSPAKDRVHSDVLSCFVRLLEARDSGENGVNASDGASKQQGILHRAVLKLLAVWLLDSASSVMKFLSSPSHVPLIVQVVNSGPKSTDSDGILAKGLASVILGVCVLAKVEKDGSPGSDALFFTSSSVLDVVSKHIGLHKFFCCWDDLTNSNAFKHGLFPLRTAKVITKKEVEACFALASSPGSSSLVVEAFFGYHAIFSSFFSTTVKELQPRVKQGVVSSYSGPQADTNTSPAPEANRVVDEDLVRKLQDEIKQLRSRNEDLATDLLAVSQSATSSAATEVPVTTEAGGQGAAVGAGNGAGDNPPKQEEQVNKKELMASKAKQAELDIALRESDKKVEDLERQLHKSAQAAKEMEERCTSAQQQSSKHENDLKDLSEAYNTLEEHSFNLESKIKEMEKQLEEKAQGGIIDKDKIEREAEVKFEARLSAMQGELDNSNKLCSELMRARDSLKETCEALQVQVADLESSLRAAVASSSAEKASSVDESALEEARSSVQKDMAAQMEEALRNKNQEHELELESLKEQLHASQAKYKEVSELYKANAGKAYTEEELSQATEQARNEAAADCDEEIFQLETKLRDMQAKLTAATQSQSQQQASKSGIDQNDLEAAVEKAKEEAMAEADESMNDLLVCLGQEEKKTEILRERLESLGENVDELLEGLEDDEEDDEEDD